MIDLIKFLLWPVGLVFAVGGLMFGVLLLFSYPLAGIPLMVVAGKVFKLIARS